MTKYKLEYIWLDGYEPTPNLRSKTKVKAFDAFPSLEELPVWGFDGSSTRQAEGSDSDCLLQPVAIFPDPARRDGALVMCEVMLPDGTPHPEQQPRDHRRTTPTPGSASSRSTSSTATAGPSGSRTSGFPLPQGEYYTGVGFRNVGDGRARDRRRAHRPLHRRRPEPRGRQRRGREGPVGVPDLRQGLEAGGRRAVDRALPAAAPLRAVRRRRQLPSEAARRRRSTGTDRGCTRTSRRSTSARSAARRSSLALMAAFDEHKDAHIAVYGPDNHMRLTGLHETQAIDKFNHGVADRGASIRVPHSFVANGYRGYLEDRRPNSLARSLPDHRAYRADDPEGRRPASSRSPSPWRRQRRSGLHSRRGATSTMAMIESKVRATSDPAARKAVLDAGQEAGRRERPLLVHRHRGAPEELRDHAFRDRGRAERRHGLRRLVDHGVQRDRGVGHGRDPRSGHVPADAGAAGRGEGRAG